MTGCMRGVCRAVVAAFLLFSTTLVWSQGTSTGTVAGQVSDPSNAVVVGATVTLTDSTTGKSQTATSNEAGRYLFANVPLGTYDVTVSKQGFAQTKVAGQAVDVGATTTINVTMQVGAQTETVTVEASGAQLQTTNATVGTSLSFQNLQELPNLGRDASSLVELQPGISMNGSTAGTVRDQNTFQLDGGNNTNDMDGTMNTYTPSFASGPGGTGGGPTGVMPTPVESIEEFKVNVTNQTSDFNGSAGAQVQMVTRRGGNAWHGSAYEFYFGSNLGANTWGNNHTPVRNGAGVITSPTTPLPSNHYNRFGAAAGGPVGPKILGGKTYLFMNYEGRRFPQNAQIEKSVPSATMRAGIVYVQDTNGTFRPFNLNPTAVTVSGVSNGQQQGTFTFAPANCTGNLGCDPRNLGVNSVVQKLWTYEPMPNDFTFGDTYNTQGFLAPIKLPQNDNIGIARLDHDFSEKWHFMGSLRYYELARATSDQYDVGGLLAGGSLGSAVPTSNRPQYPWLYVAQMTTAVTPTLSNNFNYSFLRNWWQWGTRGGVPQTAALSGLGGALEIGGESTNALIPYNVNTQSTRSRFWNGHDQTFRDDLTLIHGNHLFTFGGSVQHNYDGHGRNDNGGGIDVYPTYQIGASSSTSGAITGLAAPSAPTTTDSLGGVCSGSCVPSSNANLYRNLYAEVLGIVSQSQTVFSRQLPNLSLLPQLTPIVANVVTDYYAGYWGDSWKVKPSITLNYGLSYLLQMPPYETSGGKQVMLVDQNDQPVYVQDYLKQRQLSALSPTCTNTPPVEPAGATGVPSYSCSIYNPVLGFAAVPFVGKGRKYPYDVFYGGFSPHVAAAWNPHFSDGILGKLTGVDKTVLRAGYSRIYGRLNGVANILTPLLTPSLLQAAQCTGVINDTAAGGTVASGANHCLNVAGGATPTTAFRIGTDGTTAPLFAPSPTLPQPYIPGAGQFLTAPAGDALGLDPAFRPNTVTSIDVTLQRQISNKAFIEFGYIGRLIDHELIDLDINSVPYMTTLGGQTLANAFGKLYTSLCGMGATCTGSAPAAGSYGGPVLPFFEQLMGGASSWYCTHAANGAAAAYGSCTAAIANKQFSNLSTANVYSMWTGLAGAQCTASAATCAAAGAPVGSTSFVLGRTLPASNPPGGCVTSLNPVACAQTAAVGQSLSIGSSNYHAGFVSFNLRDFHGFTGTSNFTWSHALGMGATTQSTSLYTVMDPWNLKAMYGEQFFDTKFIFNQGLTYHPIWFRNQSGLVGRLLGGWGLSPLFVAQSGLPNEINIAGDCQSFGESNCDDSTNENAVLTGAFPMQPSLHYGVTSSGSAGKSGNVTPSCIVNGAVTCGGVGLNAYGDPQAAWSNLRPLILGVDTLGGGGGRVRGFPRWNLDLQVTKDTKFTERTSAMFYATFTNVLNHFQPSDPTLSLTSPSSFGVVTGAAFNQRQLELGARLAW